MDRLSIFLTLPIGAVICGAIAIVAMSLGFYNWPVIIGGLIVGYALSWPVSYYVSRRIKRNDNGFDHRRVEDVGPIPNPNAREV
ncbi:hypothetical protein [Yoonia litorea]|uniref:Uncharacterized protein n=1 Tax=Yoonia litorea TaxID=1123755 RepID=A0A1I6MJ98_9RHOB|nr:hypothetical protein [Yoonia litorea]SFS15749.1 hypothetical protein SAMN05444714_1901 [Yoonia litorea]